MCNGHDFFLTRSNVSDTSTNFMQALYRSQMARQGTCNVVFEAVSH
jgi:hypothetical protein